MQIFTCSVFIGLFGAFKIKNICYAETDYAKKMYFCSVRGVFWKFRALKTEKIHTQFIN